MARYRCVLIDGTVADCQTASMVLIRGTVDTENGVGCPHFMTVPSSVSDRTFPSAQRSYAGRPS
jgi:hypothetical protein